MMAQEHVQTILGKLVTDGEFAKAFFANPEKLMNPVMIRVSMGVCFSTQTLTTHYLPFSLTLRLCLFILLLNVDQQ